LIAPKGNSLGGQSQVYWEYYYVIMSVISFNFERQATERSLYDFVSMNAACNCRLMGEKLGVLMMTVFAQYGHRQLSQYFRKKGLFCSPRTDS
jgi:hypothetical protein